MCNLAVVVFNKDIPVAVLAMSLDAAVRTCIVQAIHVTPAMRGPMQLSVLVSCYGRVADTQALAEPSYTREKR